MIRPIIERTNTYNFCAKTELTEEEKKENDEALFVFNQLRNKK